MTTIASEKVKSYPSLVVLLNTIKIKEVCWLLLKHSLSLHGSAAIRVSVRSTRGLGPTMTARGQSIGISIGMLPQTLIMSITVQKTSKYYTT